MRATKASFAVLMVTFGIPKAHLRVGAGHHMNQPVTRGPGLSGPPGGETGLGTELDPVANG